jgi:hypothetical protein
MKTLPCVLALMVSGGALAGAAACNGSSPATGGGPDAGDDATGGGSSSGSGSGGGSSGALDGATSSSGAGSSSGGGSSSGVEASTLDASFEGCAPIPSPTQASSPAEGTIAGSGLSGVLCPGGATARIESAGARSDTEPYIFFLDYTVETGTAGPVTDFVFASPTGAMDGEIGVLLGIPSAAPGEYDSPAGQQCGTMAFTYYLPVSPTLNCEGGVPPSCSPGCGAVCSGQGCSPCTPQAPSFGYTAQGSADCIGSALTASGSWHLSLTSVTPGGDAGAGSTLEFFVPHGTLTATMVGDGDAGTATLTSAF